MSKAAPRVLSIIIPVFNEAGTIEDITRLIENADAPGLEKELVFVDDCSTDGSREILQKLEAGNPDWRFVYHERNQGKGAALRSGFKAARGDVLLIQDADLEYDPADYPALLAPILQGRADVVYGSRFLGGGAHRVVFFWHYVGNRLLTTLSNMMTDLNLTDMEVCYKAFARKVLAGLTLQENRFGFEVEFTAKVARAGWRVYEVPISYHGRTYEEGKKITWRDGFRALWCILKYRFF